METLNSQRIPDLIMTIDRCSIKELQDMFPSLISSIFGNNMSIGWGLRVITPENNFDFNMLYNFFNPLGPMFTMIYRLLNDSLKFDIPITSLPTNLRQLLESGRYPPFYSDIINVDSFTRQISHVSLNAFDYYMLHFAIHGMINLHKNYPMAMRIHTDKLKTVYFTLTADYFCVFLPSSPETVILPNDICGAVKTSSPPIQINTIRPSRSPVYIKLSALSRHKPAVQSPTRVNESGGRNNFWRTESVLYIFVDTWIRYNFDESRDLPSSEFIRMVRILVKQVHTFGNSSEIDNSSMSELRKIAQPMLCAQMYPFLKRIIDRWPLDCSFLIVLEVWLSYIQPWRYTYNRDLDSSKDIVLTQRFVPFIQDNLQDYTQIFIQLLPRYERLDLSSLKSLLMLYRLIKVFSQQNLGEILKYQEEQLAMTSPKKLNISPAKTLDRHRPNLGDFSYQFLFQTPVKEAISRLLKRVQIAEKKAKQELTKSEMEAKEKYDGFWNSLRCLFLSTDELADKNNLEEKKRIPEILQTVMKNMSDLFNIELSEVNMDVCYDPTTEIEDMNSTQFNSEMHSFDRSFPSPLIMRSRIPTYTGDPALIPVRSNEVTFMVRFLHQFCCKINTMFSSELQNIWNSQDWKGKLVRPLLTPPMTATHIEKSMGYSWLKNEQLGPRINLRYLASYGTLSTIFISLLLGQFLFRRPTWGVILLVIFSILICYIRSAFKQLKQTN